MCPEPLCVVALFVTDITLLLFGHNCLQDVLVLHILHFMTQVHPHSFHSVYQNIMLRLGLPYDFFRDNNRIPGPFFCFQCWQGNLRPFPLWLEPSEILIGVQLGVLFAEDKLVALFQGLAFQCMGVQLIHLIFPQHSQSLNCNEIKLSRNQF